MSFLSDAFEGNWGNLGTDISHAGSSLMHHPSEMWEVGGAAAALATGGLALGALPEFGAAGAAAEGGGMLGGVFGGGEAAAGVGEAAAADATSLGFGTGGINATEGALDAAGAGGSVIPEASGTAVDAAGNAINPLATGGAGGVAPAGAAAPSEQGFFSGITDSIMHPTLKGVAQGAGVLAAGAGLGMNILRGDQTDPNKQKLADLAGQLGSQGQVLESYLKTGKLPPAMQAKLDQAKASERARIIAGYAQRGQPTDPRMNSALAQELNNLDTNAVAAMAEVQVQMLNAGLKETGMSMQLYETLTKLDMQENQDLMKSIMGMAAALSGGFGGSPARAA